MTVENLSAAFGNITTLVGDMFSVIGGNAVLGICFAAGLVPVVIGIISSLKHA